MVAETDTDYWDTVDYTDKVVGRADRAVDRDWGIVHTELHMVVHKAVHIAEAPVGATVCSSSP